LQQDNKIVIYSEDKTIVEIMTEKMAPAAPRHNKADYYHQVSSASEVILFRLRSGHNKRKHEAGQSDIFPCENGPMTNGHLLQHCPIHYGHWQTAWPDDVP